MHFGYKPVKGGIIVLLFVIEYCFGFGHNLLVKVCCIQHILNAINDKLLDELAMFMFENKEELPSMKGSKIVVKTTKNGLEFEFDND